MGRQATCEIPLRTDQQQLAGHKGGFCRGPNPRALGHPKKLEQAEMHDHSKGHSEPPAPQTHDNQSEQASRQTTDHALPGDGLHRLTFRPQSSPYC